MTDMVLSHHQVHKVVPLEVKIDADCLDSFHENATKDTFRKHCNNADILILNKDFFIKELTYIR